MSTSTIRNITVAIALMLVSVGVFGLMAYQMISQGNKLSEQIIALENERKQETSFLRLQRIALDTTEKRSELAGYYLLKEGDSIDFLNRVESLAAETGLQLQTQNLEEIADEKSDSMWIQVTFDISGSRKQLQDFIRVIETLPYVLTVNRISLRAKSSAEWGANVRVKIRVLEYDE